MVHQELQILPLMNVEENIFIGEEITCHRFANKRKCGSEPGIIGYGKYGSNSNNQGYGYRNCGRQLLEIARAINHNAKIIILDEPTSSLSQTEIEKFFEIIKKLKAEIYFIFISHRLEEVFELQDKIIVLKDGSKVAEFDQRKQMKKKSFD